MQLLGLKGGVKLRRSRRPAAATQVLSQCKDAEDGFRGDTVCAES